MHLVYVPLKPILPHWIGAVWTLDQLESIVCRLGFFGCRHHSLRLIGLVLGLGFCPVGILIREKFIIHVVLIINLSLVVSLRSLMPRRNMLVQLLECDRLRNGGRAEDEPALWTNPRYSIIWNPVGVERAK